MWATAAPAACSLEQVTQMPLLSLGAHYAVMVGVEDVVRPMEVDTGAATTVLKATVATELGIKQDPIATHARPATGVGQKTADFHLNVIPSVLAFGSLVLHNRSTVVATMDEGNAEEGNSIGLLGDDILSQYDVEFDFPGHKLTFYREIGCYDTLVPWAGSFATVPFAHRDAKVTIDIMLNQERTRAIVDTGNNMSFVSKSASALWGSYESDIAPQKGSMRSPLNHARPFALSAYRFARVVIGGDVFDGRKMNVVDVNFPLASANIGLDYWSSRKVWISYPRGWMFVADEPDNAKLAYPVTAPAIAAPPAAGPAPQAAGPATPAAGPTPPPAAAK
ncbi:MAG: retroviral-like aspartic protease family protein [Hyphomicrobiales bacterium]|nr:retroviral-like aspartic protease family protein [Hyphomicrobiales bacterium]MBV8661615.1 retroviral-like aspartic protease family protein [Hyphomicrobiales bacterium]